MAAMLTNTQHTHSQKDYFPLALNMSLLPMFPPLSPGMGGIYLHLEKPLPLPVAFLLVSKSLLDSCTPDKGGFWLFCRQSSPIALHS